MQPSDHQAPQAAARIVADAMAAYHRGDLDGLAQLVHPDAEIEMLLLEGQPARGPDGLRDALASARDRIHRPTVSSIEEIAGDAVLMVGRIQYADERGAISDRKAVWLSVLREGKVWRTRLLGSESEARAVYAELARSGTDAA